jgi:RNA polymerase sigma-70 factor (ECF subfamily)
VDPRRFVAYLAERAASPGALASLHASDLYLACACARADEQAMQALEDATFDEHDAALCRILSRADLVAEVKQRARLKLFLGGPDAPPRIAEYEGRGELRTFVRVLLTREALSLRRAERRRAPPEEDEAHPAPAWEATDPELLHLRRTYAAEFERAFHEAIAELTGEERSLLRYHYVDRLNIDHIGAIYGVHRVSAARRLNKVRARLVEAARGKLAAQLRLGHSELRSVLRLLDGQVDVSLRRALGEAPAKSAGAKKDR